MKSRCKKVAQLLTTDSPVALIGESMGFEDQHVFSRAFKKTGASPRHSIEKRVNTCYHCCQKDFKPAAL
jgi:AraC-like DNA-binding protein